VIRGEALTLGPGEAVFTRGEAAEILGIQPRAVRKSIEFMRDLGMLARNPPETRLKPARKYTLITVENWDVWCRVAEMLAKNPPETRLKPARKSPSEMQKIPEKKSEKTPAPRKRKKYLGNEIVLSEDGFFENISDEFVAEMRRRFPGAKVRAGMDRAARYCAAHGKRYKDYGAFIANWIDREWQALPAEERVPNINRWR